jgi:hypothetical protein
MGNSIRASASFGYFVAQFFPGKKLATAGHEFPAYGPQLASEVGDLFAHQQVTVL